MSAARRPSRRDVALALIRSAGYHDDGAAYARAYVEGPVSRAAADEAWRAGRRARAAGVPCSCPSCKPRAPA